MSSPSISDFYRPPQSLSVATTDNAVIFCSLAPDEPLSVSNRTLSRSRWYQAFHPECELVCSGLFNVDLTVKVNRIRMQGKNIRPKLFTFSALQSFEITLIDNRRGHRAFVEIDFHMPSFTPFVSIGLRMKVDGCLVYEQGKIPKGYFLFRANTDAG